MDICGRPKSAQPGRSSASGKGTTCVIPQRRSNHSGNNYEPVASAPHADAGPSPGREPAQRPGPVHRSPLPTLAPGLHQHDTAIRRDSGSRLRRHLRHTARLSTPVPHRRGIGTGTRPAAEDPPHRCRLDPAPLHRPELRRTAQTQRHSQPLPLPGHAHHACGRVRWPPRPPRPPPRRLDRRG
jgi:hypothetical protein